MTTRPRTLSLCSGYGGLDLAVEEVFGAETVAVADIDRDASAVLDVRYPDVPNLGDLKTIDWSEIDADIVTAGYPCQPFSQAGRRLGADDPRHLWPEVLRAIRVVRPRYAVLENVRGHLVLGFDRVLADLAAEGFDVEWVVLRASDIGAPHQRARLFILAANTDCESAGRDGRADARAQVEDAGRGTNDRDGSAHGCRAAADPDGEVGHQRQRLEAAARPTERQRPADCGGRPAAERWGKFAPAVERWERTIGRPAPWPPTVGKQLNARLSEWMMGLPDGWVTDIIPNRRALHTLGNGVVPQQAAAALRCLLRD